ncbi:MAG TPA: hypothetical protein PK079_08340 [Leptospiraceae bacterium]|nr:hypothetical protein [Leptospiraceae bacterium]HMX30987.1 hypothetical protein [Leptospiraceae bacterium]HMY32194.1 hypothetical protein [Leptospiraceae bacterium]HMZ63805.1 hypothetical protein [Leptospiraceae bacterium]HNA06765.1 hypothetical protein [Leptospiraceae bacterium]
MIKYISILIFISLIYLNYSIYTTTEKKMDIYSKNPPFRLDDFTKSYRKNKLSQVKNLRDQDSSTYWIKEQNSFHPEYDLETELTLTHFYKEGIFKKKNLNSITIHSCNPIADKSFLVKPNNLVIDIYLREAINVDKELRLPKDEKISSILLSFQDKTSEKVDLTNILKLADSKDYPIGIYILTLFIKDNSNYPLDKKVCISEITVEE